MQKRENEQLKILIREAENLDKILEKYGKQLCLAAILIDNDQNLGKIEAICSRLKTLLMLFQFEVADLRELLDDKIYKTIEFSLMFDQRMRNESRN